MNNKLKISLPNIGFGTFGSDKYDETTVANAVYTAIKAGYRLFDCASVYGNEKQIGEIFKKAFDQGLVRREDLYVTSKVWNDMHGAGDVIKSCKQSLYDLNLDYVDLYFVHWPFPNYHARGCSAESRNPNSRPFFADEFIEVWRQMEELKAMGLAGEIGMSNMTVPKFESVLPHCSIMPFAHEMELHPGFQQNHLFDYCIKHDILPIGYCPLGSPNRPQRDKTPEDVVDTELPQIVKIARERNCHPAEICLKWAVQRGQIPIPFSSSEKNIVNNLKAVSSVPLTEAEMQSIAAADRECRLVKGQVFLWNGAESWTELWDVSGKIEGWTQENSLWKKGEIK